MEEVDMEIKVNKHSILIKGNEPSVLSGLAMLTESLRETNISEEAILFATKLGIVNFNEKNNKSEKLNKILKKLGVEKD